MANLLTFRVLGGGSENKFPFQKLQKKSFWNQQEHAQKVTSKQMLALTPRTEGKARGFAQHAVCTFWVRGPGDPPHSTQSFCLLPEEAAIEVLWKTDSLSRGQQPT